MLLNKKTVVRYSKEVLGLMPIKKRTPEVRYLESGVMIVPKVIYIQSTNIYLGTT